MDKFELPVIQEQSACGCGAATAESENTVPDLNQSFVSGSIDTPAGNCRKYLRCSPGRIVGVP